MNDFTPSYNASAGTYTPDRLHAGDFPIRTLGVTLVSGQNLTRGALVGVITASGKCKLSAVTDDDGSVTDGSQTPVGILAEDCDASGGDKATLIYISGDFNTRAMTLGTGHTAASTRLGLAARGIYTTDAVPA